MVRVMAFAVALLLLVTPTARAEIYWTLAGTTQGPIGGDATFSGEEGSIQLRSMNFGFASSGFTGGGSAPSLSVNAMSLSKGWDSASVNLVAALSTREAMSTCVFRVYGPGAGAVQPGPDGVGRMMPMGFDLEIELIGARVDSYSLGGSEGSPSESLSLVFEEIRIRHMPSQGTFVWSIVTAPRAAASTFPGDAALPQGTANPFEFALPDAGDVTIDVTDTDGRTVRSLVYGDVAEYEGSVVWDATDDAGQPVTPGVYVATQRENGREITRRIVIGR